MNWMKKKNTHSNWDRTHKLLQTHLLIDIEKMYKFQDFFCQKYQVLAFSCLIE